MDDIQKMTKYFRDSVAAELKIDFRNKDFITTHLEDVLQGKMELGEDDFKRLLDSKNEKLLAEPLNVMIVAKTIKTIYDGQQRVHNKIEEMSGIFYIPAVLYPNGMLAPSDGKLPWIPREHLFPIIDPELAIGNLTDFDEFVSENMYRLKEKLDWVRYISFAKEMYEQVTSTALEARTVKGIELENHVYLFKDDTIRTTASILKLYDDLQAYPNLNELKLYQTFMKREFTPLQPLIKNTYEEMNKHAAQMGGEYPLSPSQRECVNHFNHMEEGEILAVNGPPGTGKTTLLQSLVANLFTERALKKETAPLIVASSTNNQAVTNIIESFGKIETKWNNSHLEHRWVEGVHSFAVYFPSQQKEKEAKQKGFHFTNFRDKKNFFAEAESKENIEASIQKMLKECNQYFQMNFRDVKQCENTIWHRLVKVNDLRKRLLEVFHSYEGIRSEDEDMETCLQRLILKKEKLEKRVCAMKKRRNEWDEHFASMPLFYCWFLFLPFVKRKAAKYIRSFIQPDEDFIHEAMNAAEVKDIYREKINAVRKEMNHIRNMYIHVTQLKEIFEEVMEELIRLEIIEKHPSFTTLEEVNEFSDTTMKYAAFWLAVHYYECRWLTAERLSEKQQGTNLENVQKIFFANLPMLTPCFVMTFFQLSKLLLVYGNGKEKYLYNYIDLLIVDEAGQVTPEIAACSFALAKKAVVVGDVDQIEPVWNIHQSLDLSLALSNQVIPAKEQFPLLKELGLNTSDSSVMKAACKCSKYQKYEDRGLFLSEHRRCYDEIIEYCNQLVYQGNLEPMRGKAANDPEYPLARILTSPLSHIQVDSDRSSKRAGSRFNKEEAAAIAAWIHEHFQEICDAYPKDVPRSLVGIITPFKAQVAEIKRALHPQLKPLIDVGTVHTFQGGERKLIIMSTVYGKQDGCFFLDMRKSLLNVAVSRAKDGFLIFGDINSLSDSESKPSGLLKKSLKQGSIENKGAVLTYR
ncbi:AAA domain-containing protein [Bacillus benzoevorans]|uniref:Energy-coupling factor transporter ATP-binding protein EcfA2 n=1 Tax=Bacillus benzoevorans TaxID=1456 RepID=A0A7X0HTV3_9BACI|nr:AAA domain-containing protein [Bacillus benzoevorans]MBB6446738.1 energy-coupling factor transporter ATP-binding protein EcfA2 [Bacillus benzoevorans]